MKATPRTAMAVVIAVVALVLSAGAGATAAQLITGKQIKNNTVTTKDIKNRTLKAKDLSLGAKNKLRGATGATGPAGPAGVSGISGFQLVVPQGLAIPAALPMPSAPLTASCPAGKKALAGTASFSTPVGNLVSQVTRVDERTFQAAAIPVPMVGPILANTLNLEVVCAAVAS